MKAISLAPYTFSLPKDKTVFNLRPLTGIENLERQNYLYGMESATNQAFVYTVRTCLIGWSKLQDDKGQDVIFDEESQDNNFNYLSADNIADLYNEIVRASEVSKKQKKS